MPDTPYAVLKYCGEKILTWKGQLSGAKWRPEDSRPKSWHILYVAQDCRSGSRRIKDFFFCRFHLVARARFREELYLSP